MFVPKSLDDLKRVIQERLQEDVQLEFKRQLPESGKNDDIARDLAAMANTEGGVIIYGIGQDDQGCAQSLMPFPVSGAAERVSQVAQTLDGPLTLTTVFAILSDEEGGSGYLVVEVPCSERAPHLYRGCAWSRTAKGNVPLTRRRVGELFARQPGFAAEFGLALGRPGRVIARLEKEQYQQSDGRGGLRARTQPYLVLLNDGDEDVFDVDWEWLGGSAQILAQNPFPLDTFQVGLQVRIRVQPSVETRPDIKVRTQWRDRAGARYEQT